MITLTMQCTRCGKEVSHDMTNKRLNEELVRKFGFAYQHDGRANLLICYDCEKEYADLKAKLDENIKRELCSFFKSCGKEKDNGNKRERTNV